MHELTIASKPLYHKTGVLHKSQTGGDHRVGELIIVNGNLLFSFSGSTKEPIRTDNITFIVKKLSKDAAEISLIRALEARVAELEQICSIT